MKTVVVAGARPNFVKVAPLLKALQREGVDTDLVHTGQHYDWTMSEVLFHDLGIPPPDVNLEVGSASHAVQTAKVMMAFEDYLDQVAVDQIVVVGDVNSTLACTLVGAKREVPVAHVEAGLRSFDRSMPEEINRVAVDAIASWLFTPSADADANLLAEGVRAERIFFVGNIMVDSLLANLEHAMNSTIASDLGLEGAYGLVTLHRPALVDDAARFRDVLRALEEIARDVPLVFPAHPRTRVRLESFGLNDLAPHVRLVEPIGYLDFLRLEAEAAIVLTDSGGIQEETTVLGVPCVTLRDNTERPITVTDGTNEVAGMDGARIRAAATRALGAAKEPRRPPLWDGQTADRIAHVLGKNDPPSAWVPSDMLTQGSPEDLASTP